MTKKALVVVLGELARSPRMQYHCMSLASNNYDVTVIATGGKDKSCHELESSKRIKQTLMSEAPNFKKYIPTILAYLIRPIWQSFVLIYHLLLISIPHVIIVQNPPTIPSVPILCIYSRLTGSRLIIDWHNYGYSILSLNMNQDSLLVRVSKSIEVYFGRLANAGLCVSKAMREDLINNFKIEYQIHVLYDKPPKHFKPLTLREKHNFYNKIKNQISQFRSSTTDIFKTEFDEPDNLKTDTRFTRTDISEGVVLYKTNRPAIIMTSTSWTEDEDFDLLFEALKRYDETRTMQIVAIESNPEEFSKCLPNLVCIITGKGPLKAFYESKIENWHFDHVEVALPWLSAEDYPKMVASCDLGVSLHSSSSGVDLPMKVVDMFGCGIPCLAYNYTAISELVVDDFYGLTFNDSADLLKKLVLVLTNFYMKDQCSRDDIECSPLGRYRKNIKRHFLLSRWEDNWNREAKPVIDKLSSSSN